MEVLAPVEAEPGDVFLDRLDELDLLLGRVGVVEAQVAAAAEILGDTKTNADRLGVADVQVAIGLRWKSGDDPLVSTRFEIGPHDVTQKIPRALFDCCLGHITAPKDTFATEPRGPAGPLSATGQGWNQGDVFTRNLPNPQSND